MPEAHFLPRICRSLIETELEAVEVTSPNGYYETPRETTVDELANQFGVSKAVVSTNLRRSEQSVSEVALAGVEQMDGSDQLRKRR